MSEQVTYSEQNWYSEVSEADKDLHKDDIGYEFSNGRKFNSTDRYDTGVYDGS